MVSSTIKTDRHDIDIVDILLKVALNTITIDLNYHPIHLSNTYINEV